jgi:hypothetical protein
MLLHLPIAILATFSPIAVTVPKFDIARECRLEGGSTPDFDRCSRDEAIALRQLQQAWTKFAGADKETCVGQTTIGGFASYVELLTCLEMAHDAASPNRTSMLRWRVRTSGVRGSRFHPGRESCRCVGDQCDVIPNPSAAALQNVALYRRFGGMSDVEVFEPTSPAIVSVAMRRAGESPVRPIARIGCCVSPI